MPYFVVMVIFFCFLTICVDKLLRSFEFPKNWWNRRGAAKYKNQIFIGIFFASLIWPVTLVYMLYCWLTETDDE